MYFLLAFLTFLPGIHPNLFIPFAWSMGPLTILFIYCFYKFSQFVQSFYLYSPGEETSLAMNPFFSLRRKMDVLKACLLSCLISICIGILICKPLLSLLSLLKHLRSLSILLLLLSTLLILKSRFPLSIFYFLCFGILGILCFKLCSDPFFHLFTGTFGLPFLISYKEERLRRKRTKLNRKAFLKGNLAALLSSFFLVQIPLIGPITSLYFVSAFLKPHEFVYAVGSLSGYELMLSIYMLHVYGYSRSGFLNTLVKLHTAKPFELIPYILLFSLSSFILVSLLSIPFERLSIGKRARAFLLFLILLVAMHDPIGIPFLLACSFLSLRMNEEGVRLSNGLGSVILPYFLNLI